MGRGKGDDVDVDETNAMVLMLNVGSTLNRAALGHPAPRAIPVASYTGDYVVSS